MAGRGRRAPRTAAPKPEGSTRMCIGCRGLFPRESLIRIVRGPAGEIGVDRYLRAPGRGAHLCYSRSCIEAAIKRKAVGRAFPGVSGGTQVPDADSLIAEVVTAIDARLTDALALGRMRRETAAGADALEAAWGAGTLRFLIMATDVAENTDHRWMSRAHAVSLPTVHFGTAEELGRTHGAEARVAVGIINEGLAERVRIEFERRGRVLVAA
jgi:predicted RNA-binding protein YlxR (DUF448 family)